MNKNIEVKIILYDVTEFNSFAQAQIYKNNRSSRQSILFFIIQDISLYAYEEYLNYTNFTIQASNIFNHLKQNIISKIKIQYSGKDEKNVYYPNQKKIAVAMLFDHFLNKCRFLTKLDMSSSRFKNFQASLIFHSEWKFLKVLDLSDNFIHEQGVMMISRSIYHYLQIFDISKNYIGNKGLKHICKAQWPQLKELYLRDTNITYDSFKNIHKSCFKGLNVINMSFPKHKTDSISQLATINCDTIILSTAQTPSVITLIWKLVFFNKMIKFQKCRELFGDVHKNLVFKNCKTRLQVLVGKKIRVNRL